MLPTIKRILIVPDFGNAEAAERLLPLKEALREELGFNAKIIDLRQMIIDENPDKKLNDVQILDLAARRLETLAKDKSTVWERPLYRYRKPTISETEPEEEIQILDLAACCLETLAKDKSTVWERPLYRYRKPTISETEPEEEKNIYDDKLTHRCISKYRVSIQSYDKYQNSPHVIVVFGKSVMLAGGVKDVPVLFINPVYDEEWPWRKRYYADRKESDDFYKGFIAMMNAPLNPQKLNFGYGIEHRGKKLQRFCLLTERKDSDEFSRRYPRLVMSDPELSDPGKLVEAITEFTMKKLETPLTDIYEMLKIPYRGDSSKALEFPFHDPVEVEGHKATAILLEGCSPYRMPGEVVLMEAPPRNRSLEGIHDRQSLLRLREALAEAVKTMPQKKRILIIPDLLTPSDSPIIPILVDELQEKDYYVAVFESFWQLKNSRKRLGRLCKSKPFDLIVTIETGCLLATRVTNALRIFVNPNWTVWKDMKRGGYEREAWETARTMGMKENILRNGPHLATGWFTPDLIDSETPQEHMKRFGSAIYPPYTGLTTESEIRRLGREIHKMLIC